MEARYKEGSNSDQMSEITKPLNNTREITHLRNKCAPPLETTQDATPTRKATVLLVGKCNQRETGNATTLFRLGSAVRDGGWNSIIRDVDSIPDKASLCNLLKQHNIVTVVGLHAYRSADILLCCQELGVPYVTVFGGTDVNECVNDECKMKVMERVVTGAKALVAFHSSMGESVLRIWPSLSHDILWIMPQATDVYSDSDFNIIPYLERVEHNHMNNTTNNNNNNNNNNICLDTNTSKINNPEPEESVQSAVKHDGIHSEDSSCMESVGLHETTDENRNSKKNVISGNEEAERLDKTQELPDQFHPLVVLVAGLRPVKDVLYLTEEWSNWQQGRGGRGRFLIVGPSIDPHYSAHVEAQAKRLNGVRVCPSLSPQQCQAVIKSATVLVNSSCSEGMASSILEAMALGTPVVVRDIPGNTSLVTHRENGLVFSCPKSFIAELECLLQDSQLRDSMVAAARRHIDKNHSLQREKDLLVKIIDHVLQ